MLQVLDEIRRRANLENLWQGEGALDLARQRLANVAPDADPAARHAALLEAGHHELRMGNEPEAIARFREAYELLPRLAGRISADERARTAFRYGVSWLRRGETANCASRHGAESCILPLRGAGIHQDQEGSRHAIRLFREVIESTPKHSIVHAKALWLLNIAHMTLGEYPHGVPEAYRIPEDVFASDLEFPRFENVAPELGIGGWTLFGSVIADDFDGDGWIDVMVTASDIEGHPRYFRNNRDGTFTERGKEAGLEGLHGGLNAIQADYDNDGDVDAFILRGAWLSVAGRHPSSLLRNDGGGVFTDVTFLAGLGDERLPTQTGAWADYDNDGNVDLYVGSEHGDHLFDGPCRLYRNSGDGTFTEVAKEAGVDHRGFVKGVVWGDYDEDGFPDLYVSTLGGPNRLYHNNRDGTFTDVAPQAGVDRPIYSFPVWFWDFDNDGHLDLYVPSYKGVVDAVGVAAISYFGAEIPWERPALYRGDGRGGFRDVAADMGLDRFHLPMGANFGDVDGDGWLDFYLGTGYPDYEGLLPNVLYRNLAGRGFADVTMAAGVGHLQKGHGIAFFDYDHDGDLDIYAQMGGAFPGDRFADALFANPGFGNHWIELVLEGRRTNRSAIGARIRVDVEENGRMRSIYRVV
ncbi:MAG TPA: FG-GAP-like repeat-containing protein, partial [Thermoanaerobaculia bacterium]|nr:FG-GAP-like repeat-containing protein [Thermoanaerobaculia bacterium]